MKSFEKVVKLNIALLAVMSATACSSIPEVARVVLDEMEQHVPREYRKGYRIVKKTAVKEVTAYLSAQEEKKLLAATQRSLSTNQVGISSKQGWKSSQRANVQGTTQVTGEYQAKNGLTCRVISQMTTGPKGEMIPEERHWCQEKDGRWSAVVQSA